MPMGARHDDDSGVLGVWYLDDGGHGDVIRPVEELVVGEEVVALLTEVLVILCMSYTYTTDVGQPPMTKRRRHTLAISLFDLCRVPWLQSTNAWSCCVMTDLAHPQQVQAAGVAAERGGGRGDDEGHDLLVIERQQRPLLITVSTGGGEEEVARLLRQRRLALHALLGICTEWSTTSWWSAS